MCHTVRSRTGSLRSHRPGCRPTPLAHAAHRQCWLCLSGPQGDRAWLSSGFCMVVRVYVFWAESSQESGVECPAEGACARARLTGTHVASVWAAVGKRKGARCLQERVQSWASAAGCNRSCWCHGLTLVCSAALARCCTVEPRRSGHEAQPAHQLFHQDLQCCVARLDYKGCWALAARRAAHIKACSAGAPALLHT